MFVLRFYLFLTNQQNIIAELEKEKYKIENSCKTKKHPNRNGCLFWYSVLNEYRAEYASEIDDLYRLIENLSFQSQLEQFT